MQQTAQGWLVLELTNSPALLGLAGAVGGLPTLFLAVVRGRARRSRGPTPAARSPRTAPARCSRSSLASCSRRSASSQYWHVLVLAFLRGIALTIQMPASQAVVSTIVDRTAIGNAVALNSAQYNLLRIVAPARRRPVHRRRQPRPRVLGVRDRACVIVAALIAGLPIPATRPADRVQAGDVADLQDGVRFVASNRVLATIVLLPGRAGALRPQLPHVHPDLRPRHPRRRPGGLRAAHRRDRCRGADRRDDARDAAAVRRERPARRSAASAIVGVALTTFAVSRSLPLSMLALALLGTFQVSFYSTTNTLIQVLVPSRLRGRVLSLYLLTSIGLIPIGNLVGGAIAEHLGVEVVLAGGRADHGRRGRPGRLCRAARWRGSEPRTCRPRPARPSAAAAPSLERHVA